MRDRSDADAQTSIMGVVMVKIVVLLYGVDLDQAQTICTLRKLSSRLGKGFCISIWNNGPRSLKESFKTSKSIQEFSLAGLNVVLYEDLTNPPLSLVYNFVCEGAGQVVLLDQDSKVDDEYFDALEDFLSGEAEVFLPKIRVSGRYYYPITSSRKVISSSGPIELERCYSVASGMCIKNSVIRDLTRIYGGPFNEKFVFYGVDTSFFERYARAGRRSYFIGPTLEHGLSRVAEQWKSNEMKFRERFFDICLQVRLYPTVTRFFCLLKFIATSPPLPLVRNALAAIRCLVLGYHPRFRPGRTLQRSEAAIAMHQK